jgi:Spy/CpxP family protein refolding chaperone
MFMAAVRLWFKGSPQEYNEMMEDIKPCLTPEQKAKLERIHRPKRKGKGKRKPQST